MFTAISLLAAGNLRGAEATPAPFTSGPPRKLGVVSDPAINESSGLARSIRRPGWFWTHNDSGDKPRLFLLDQTGATKAVANVAGAQAVDWEDMASFELDGQPFLLVADVGNNRLNRGVAQLYLLEEPVATEADSARTLSVRRKHTMHFRFEDGPKNCESVGVDAPGKRILLASKETSQAVVYELPLALAVASDPLTAKRIAALPVSTATGMDVSPDASRLVIVNYLGGYEFIRGKSEPWADALARAPRALTLPLRRTGEAVCFDAGGTRLYLSSEGAGQPLWELPLPAQATATSAGQ